MRQNIHFGVLKIHFLLSAFFFFLISEVRKKKKAAKKKKEAPNCFLRPNGRGQMLQADSAEAEK